MTYPEIDNSVIETARAEYVKKVEVRDGTKAAMVAAQATARDAEALRARLIRKAAGGETVTAAQHAEAESAEREAVAAVARHELILAAQENTLREADKAIATANGLARRPRLLAAIRERASGAKAHAAAMTAKAVAEARMAEAHKIALDAFGAGHPIPSNIPKGANSQAEMEAWLWEDSSPTALCRLWGELALEAFNQAPAEATEEAAGSHSEGGRVKHATT